MKFLQSFCVVDASLRLLWIGGDWDDFARANGSEGAMAKNVLSTRLSAHIADIRTADKVAEMVQAVLDLQKPLRFEYRCDSPEEIRRFRLTIQPLKDQRAVMVHDLQDALRLDRPMEAWTFDPRSEDVKCSMCGSVHLQERWVDPIEADFIHPPRVSYTLCPTCEERANSAIMATVTGKVPEVALDMRIKAGLKPD